MITSTNNLVSREIFPTIPHSHPVSVQKEPISQIDGNQLQELLRTACENNFQDLKKYLRGNFKPDVVPLFLQQFKELVRKNDATKEPWKTLHHIVDRWTQLETIPEDRFETKKANSLELLKVALFIETEMVQSNEHFFNVTVTGLGWHLQRDENNVYLLASYRYSVFKSNGAFKKIAGAAQVSFKNRALASSIFAYTRMKNAEAEPLLKLQGAGVVECVNAVSLPRGKKSVVLKKYDGDAFKLIESIRTLSQRILFTRLALSALDRIHGKGYVHGDVKL